MKENNTCERCGKKNPAEIHTCTPGYYFEKENTTGQTVYEQLQEFLNESLKLGYKRFGREDILRVEIDRIGFILYGKDGGYTTNISYHDLFSVESGIMEFVKRGPENVRGHYMFMGEMTAEQKIKHFLSNAKLPTKSK